MTKFDILDFETAFYDCVRHDMWIDCDELKNVLREHRKLIEDFYKHEDETNEKRD